MSEFISGEEAKQAWANGECVQYLFGCIWNPIDDDCRLGVFDVHSCFRIKPRTTIINGIELPAQFQPQVGEVYWHLSPYQIRGYDSSKYLGTINDDKYLGMYRTEDEVKKVYEAWMGLNK